MNTFKSNKKMHLFLSVMLSFTMLLLFSGLAFASSQEETMAGMNMSNYSIQLSNPDKITQGDNDFTVTVTKDGQPVDGLAITLSAEMDSSDTSMHMSHSSNDVVTQTLTATGTGTGEYSGKLNLSSEGQWLLTVHFLDQQQTFDVTAEKSGPNLIVIASFVGVILLIVLVAALVKKRTPKEV